MVCPGCGTHLKDGLDVCPECGTPLERRAAGEKKEESGRSEWERTMTVAMRVLVHILIWIFSLSILAFGLYKAYYWYQAYSVQKRYEDGTVKMPELEVVTMDDGRTGHAITFYGRDGDMIYIEELDERYMVVGGKAVVRVADAEWFQIAGVNAASAQISLTAVQTTEKGEKTLLPIVSFNVEMPVSPLTITSPTEKYVTTMSSVYDLKLNVVYGSTVLVDGEDVTGMVDRQGNLSVSVAVYPQGENPVSILVQTPNHLETREDLVFYRQPMDIDLEIASNTAFTSERANMVIRGAVDPTAQLTIESNYDPSTYSIDEKGNFSFAALFDHYGDNTITLRAAKAGLQDSVVSFNVYYVPSINEYSRKAWKMDYQNLLYCWQEWDGRVFACKGTIVAIMDDDPDTLVIDISDDGSGKYLVIKNMSDKKITETGGRYVIYADVSGQGEYEGKTYTRLIGRYAESLD